MIRISIDRTEEGVIRGFSSSGHAGFAEEGQDIVCAAVSVLIINTINSIERLLPEDSKNMNVTSDDSKGYISISFEDNPSEKASLLLQSMYLGLKDIEKNYSGEYISFTEDRF